MTHYDEFGLTPAASPEEIQRAHRSLARLLHPDPIQDEALRRLAENQLKRLNHVYSVLIDPVRRRSYDSQLNNGRASVGMELAITPPPYRRPPPPVTPWWRAGWHIPVVAGLSLVAGFEAAVTSGPPERVVYVDRNPGTPVSAPQFAGASDGQRPNGQLPLQADALELRNMLNQAMRERDQALAKLAASLSAPSAPPAASAAMAGPASSPASGAAAEPTHGTGGVAAIIASPEIEPAGRVAQPNLAGTWIYSAPGGRPSPGNQYPAEYIELVLGERDESLSGRYRARYKVADRAMSPEVEFFFQGPAAGDRRYGWRGNGGAKGEIHLKLLSDNALSLNWFASELGQHPMLGSGTAVLVRRRQD